MRRPSRPRAKRVATVRFVPGDGAKNVTQEGKGAAVALDQDCVLVELADAQVVWLVGATTRGQLLDLARAQSASAVDTGTIERPCCGETQLSGPPDVPLQPPRAWALPERPLSLSFSVACAQQPGFPMPGRTPRVRPQVARVGWRQSVNLTPTGACASASRSARALLACRHPCGFASRS